MLRSIGVVLGLSLLVACGEGEGDDGWTQGGGAQGALGGSPSASGGGSGGGGALDPAQVAGQALFARNCAGCHGANGGNVRGRRGIAGVVRRGAGSMPPFPGLTDQNIADIEAYLNAGAAAGVAGRGEAEDGDD